MTYQPNDAATVLADFGEAVAVDLGATTTGMLTSREQAQQLYGVEIRGGTHVLAVIPGSLGGIAIDQRLTVATKPYRYRGLWDGPQDLFERHQLVGADA